MTTISRIDRARSSATQSRRALALLLLTMSAACSGASTPPTPHDSGVDSGDAGGLMCTCPCNPVPFRAPPEADACWVVSCDPICGPGSGNAC